MTHVLYMARLLAVEASYTVQLTSKFTETLVVFCVPQHIPYIALVMFSSARGTHEY